MQLSEFVWTLCSSVLLVVFNNFLLIDATDGSKTIKYFYATVLSRSVFPCPWALRAKDVKPLKSRGGMSLQCSHETSFWSVNYVLELYYILNFSSVRFDIWYRDIVVICSRHIKVLIRLSPSWKISLNRNSDFRLEEFWRRNEIAPIFHSDLRTWSGDR